jgi:hypothetical protein
MMQLGMVSVTAAHRGRHGTFFDLWAGLDNLADGDTYPNDASNQFVQIGPLIYPWNGSTPDFT